MNVNDIEKIVQLMDAHGLAEVEVEDKNGKLRIRKQGDRELVGIPHGAAHPVAPMAAAAANGARGDCICSPLVGTFYRRPSLDSEPYIKVGDRVEKDTVVCVVEAMKVMNEIKAEKSGVIKKILAEDAHPVEYMQPLFELGPA
ncbi:MAG: acetyl-CoA carboxylase biotin carboxyl carrier protein [Planctomycetota bacterium]